MTFEQTTIQHTIDGNVCRLQIVAIVQKRAVIGEGDGDAKRCISANRRNCDIFVEDHNFYIYADTRLHRFYLSERQFDTKDMKNLIINFNTKTGSYEVNLPCLPRNNEEQKALPEKSDMEKKISDNALFPAIELWKLKRITDSCQLQIDNGGELLKFEADFGYGFAGRFKKNLIGVDDMSAVARMPEPHTVSPLQRTIDREIDELKNFSRDQYKLNFVELQVPEGHENPMKYINNFGDSILTRDEECLLHNLTRKSQEHTLSYNYEQTEVDCGLISILLAICYDIRCTSNEPTCESAWTRNILSATLSYFEPFESIKDVVVSFLRRSLIYPLYRNYDLGRICVQDAIDGLQKNPAWVLKQLLQTHAIFASSDCYQEIFNRYYIEDYIRYVADNNSSGQMHLRLLARNLKNVLLDVCKKHLRLDLGEIETELLKELITDIHLGDSSASEEEEGDDDTEDDGDDEDDEDVDDDDVNDEGGTESGEDASDSSSTTTASSSSTSDTEQNSVIEQCKEVVNVSKT
ncbi:protein SHQ1 homolog [Rhagoletis pomonella]|uniref:protein SHQ1 homolog n=1 Tax=Rhagoletis pomonella TaxID=28610 RepID=UPI001781EE52|nr:protein SHQ1 homolog [Rhagoletis pomonella]